jgi:pimeloyl-ACP methyl ester carboxylesterase
MGSLALERVLMPPPFIRLTMSPVTGDDREVVRRVAARARTAGGMRTGTALWRSFARPGHDLRLRAAQLRAPTLIVWGAKDIATPLRAGRATPAAIAGSRLGVLDTGPVPFSSDPRAFLSLVMPFIERSRRT